jgi:dimethylhistidine N-methyltransferase
MTHTNAVSNQALMDAVTKGLSGANKSLPSWLFYDEEGDRIFQQIMRMPEYYPTRCEYDILQQYKDEMLTLFNNPSGTFRLIELGAGDGLKTEILLRHFLESRARFTYYPVDISNNALDILSSRLTSSLPDLEIIPQNKSYDDALAELRDSEKKVILFMGANIGNFTIQEAVQFLRKLALRLQKDDLLLIGFDLKKDPRVIHEAYDDNRGLTAEFNLNMLRRLNRELGANFDINKFTHYPTYDPETGTTKSFLISMIDQTIHFELLGKSVHFAAWEPIQTEVSQKYDVGLIQKMMALSDLQTTRTFTDADNYFADVLVKSN